MAKQYTLDELVKAWREGERGKFKAIPNSVQNVTLDDIGFVMEDGNSYYISPVDKNLLWTKVQEPVNFMVAINSGKRIKPVGFMEYLSIKLWLKNFGNTHEISSLELINGKWLIEEE